MEKKHTPAPWWASGLEVGTIPNMDVKVANVSGSSYEEALANVSLITASPKLLEAVELLWSKVDLSRFTDEEIIFIHQVVKAATK